MKERIWIENYLPVVYNESPENTLTDLGNKFTNILDTIIYKYPMTPQHSEHNE